MGAGSEPASSNRCNSHYAVRPWLKRLAKRGLKRTSANSSRGGAQGSEGPGVLRECQQRLAYRLTRREVAMGVELREAYTAAKC